MSPDARILVEEIEARADTLETYARTATRHPAYRGGLPELRQRVDVLRQHAKRIRNEPTLDLDLPTMLGEPEPLI